MEKKIVKNFTYEGLGFPVKLSDVPMMKTRGEWTPDIDYNKLQEEVLISLAKKAQSLTGNELRFIRKYFRRTLEAFGQDFGVSHAAVIDWEKQENLPIKINPATEKCIRMYILDALGVGDHLFRITYHNLEIKKLAASQKVSKRSFQFAPMTFKVKKSMAA